MALRIADAGPGIAREHLPRLTERFYRVEGQKASERPGTGLGLAIVKHIVNRHRGGLTVESAPGEGAAFSVYLPTARGSLRAVRSLRLDRRGRRAPKRRRMNILLVGSGGREHALAWKIAQSPLLTPAGLRAGQPRHGGARRDRAPSRPTDVAGQVALAREIAADLVVIGPEAAVEAGLADALAEAGIPCFGPTAAAGQLEIVQGLHQGVLPTATACRPRALRRLRGRRAGQGRSWTSFAAALRDQGRRPGRRQGRGHRAGPGRRPRRPSTTRSAAASARPARGW